MARQLGDVLHHFMPETDWRPTRRAALPIVAVPLGPRDVVGAAFTWNLAVEITRLGAIATVLAAEGATEPGLWPGPGTDTLGAQLVLTDAPGIAELASAAFDLAVLRAAESGDGGVVLACVDPAWLRTADEGRPLLHRALLLCSDHRGEQREAYALAKQLLAADPGNRVGVTIHGASSVGEARDAFRHLTAATERHLGRSLASYGLLVDEIDVYRSIVDRIPIGVARPQSPAARALRDVASLLLGDLKMDSP